MKINNTYIILLLFFFQISLGQTSNGKEIFGQVFEQSTSVEGVNIVNNNTQHTTASDPNGMFSMIVREGDVLVFSAVNLEPLKHRITAEDLKNSNFQIKMSAKEIELKEVIVNENADINAENLGIVPRGQKRYTPAERKLYTATSGNGIDGLLNTISGRKSNFTVKLSTVIHQLQEVVIKKYDNINAVSLGIVPKGQKRYTDAERKLYTGTDLDAKASVGGLSGGSISVDPFLNYLSGRTAMLKKQVAVEKKEDFIKMLENMFTMDHYINRLKIPSEYVKGFQFYAVENDKFTLILNSKNKTSIEFLLGELAEKYKELLASESK